MNENQRESFIFYRSFAQAANTLKKSEKILFYENIINYALDGIDPKPSAHPAYGMFLLVKPQIDANLRRYENGKKGGRPAKPNNNLDVTETKPRHNLDVTKPKPNVNVNVNVNDNHNGNVNPNENHKHKENVNTESEPDPGGEAAVCVAPTREEIVEYCRRGSITIDVDEFMAYYEAHDWKLKDGLDIRKAGRWKSQLVVWMHRQRKQAEIEKAAGTRKGANYSQRETDYDALLSSGLIGSNPKTEEEPLPEPYEDEDGALFVDMGGNNGQT